MKNSTESGRIVDAADSGSVMLSVCSVCCCFWCYRNGFRVGNLEGKSSPKRVGIQNTIKSDCEVIDWVGWTFLEPDPLTATRPSKLEFAKKHQIYIRNIAQISVPNNKRHSSISPQLSNPSQRPLFRLFYKLGKKENRVRKLGLV